MKSIEIQGNTRVVAGVRHGRGTLMSSYKLYGSCAKRSEARLFAVSSHAVPSRSLRVATLFMTETPFHCQWSTRQQGVSSLKSFAAAAVSKAPCGQVLTVQTQQSHWSYYMVRVVDKPKGTGNINRWLSGDFLTDFCWGFQGTSSCPSWTFAASGAAHAGGKKQSAWWPANDHEKSWNSAKILTYPIQL